MNGFTNTETMFGLPSWEKTEEQVENEEIRAEMQAELVATTDYREFHM